MKQRGQGDKHVAEHVGRAKLLLRQCLGQVLGQRLRKNTQHVSRQTRGRNRARQNPGKDIWSGSAQWSPLSAFAKHLSEEEVKFNRSISKVTIDIYNYLLTTSLLNCVAFSHSQLYLSCSHGIWSFKPLKIFCRYNRTILGKITVLRASQQGGRASLPTFGAVSVVHTLLHLRGLSRTPRFTNPSHTWGLFEPSVCLQVV